MFTIRMLCLCVALSTIPACGSAVAEGLNEADIVGKWVLAEGSVSGEPIELSVEAPATLEVPGDGSVSGRAACNQWGSSLDLVDGQIFFGQGQMTMMACQPDLMAIEDAFHRALQLVSTAVIDDGQLVLEGTDTELRFDQVEA